MRIERWLCCAMVLSGMGLGGCAVAQSTPPHQRPLRDIVREEPAEVVTVRDTMIDLRTGMGRAVRASTPRIPLGPVAVGVPVTIGGEKRLDVPGEEITVRLSTGKMIMIVQELSSPPFAPGERVRVQYERASDAGSAGRMAVVRE
ncbi:MAG TPA: hypothetical protein VM029_23305 [Opitutaceae bacterium]|nr:hypothetical protein [Opitutaceae bacterium]